MRCYYYTRFTWYGNRCVVNGRNNFIHYGNALMKNNTFYITGDNNVLQFGDSASIISCQFTVKGNEHRLEVGNNVSFFKTNFAFEDRGGFISIGDKTSILEKCEIATVENNSKVQIGAHCMFATSVDIRNSDSHSIVSNENNKRINPGKDIVIGDHVWLGAYVAVLKGVTIGKDSVIGIRSVVTKDIPSGVVAVGVPARVVKEGINWKEERI